MNNLKKLFKGIKIVTADGLTRLKEGLTEDKVKAILYNSNDPIQKILAKEVCRLNGWEVIIHEPEDEPPMVA